MDNIKLYGYNILIAEDNDINYFLLRELISQTRANCYRAINGLEAINIVGRLKNISLILMDINMPVMDGILATRKIREKNITIPIVFQTAYDSNETREECIKAGGTDFLSKPINFDKLYTVLKKYLKKVNIPL